MAITEKAHRAVKLESARFGVPMTMIVEEALKRELARRKDLRRLERELDQAGATAARTARENLT